ncbi:fimbrial protein [Citrobacter werkmanii]|uniref:fimbrial protein n=1 Tax=Citrobacter werkmanii TaxID=67827 RepID=UPI0027196B12|nr:fimbrial protein [Citrobacter werkmanii]MDO8234826.1 fimbrial protein [Citrobacter werkmanii]
MKKTITNILLLLLFVARISSAANLTFHGELIVDADMGCEINGGHTLEVYFGTIISDKIDGVNYSTDIPWGIECHDDPVHKETLTLQYLGTATSFTSDAISTSLDGLGIVLQQNGEIFHPGDSIVIDEDSPPTLKAVPIKQPGKKLAEGSFEAYAALLLDYL